jgi:lipoprotein signal peptidase
MAGCVLGLTSMDEEDSKLTAVPYVFMMAGGLGNTLERIIYGNVCDWITLTRPVSEYLLVLNFADIFICISLLTLPFTMQELKLKLFFGAIFYVLAFSPLYGVMFG